MSDSPYVSNLTSRLKDLAFLADTEPAAAAPAPASPSSLSSARIKPANTAEDVDNRYVDYSIDDDTHYATNNEISAINSSLIKQPLDEGPKATQQSLLNPQSAVASGADSHSENHLPPDVSHAEYSHPSFIDIKKHPDSIPLQDSHPEMFNIPGYSQTPVPTPVQTPSVRSASNSYSDTGPSRLLANSSCTNSSCSNPNSVSNLNSVSNPNSVRKNSPGFADRALLVSHTDRLNTLRHNNTAHSPPAEGSITDGLSSISKFKSSPKTADTNVHINANVGGQEDNTELQDKYRENSDASKEGSKNLSSNLTKIILGQGDQALVTSAHDLSEKIPFLTQEKEVSSGSTSPANSAVSNSQSSNGSTMDSNNNQLEDEGKAANTLHIKGMPAIETVKEKSSNNLEGVEPQDVFNSSMSSSIPIPKEELEAEQRELENEVKKEEEPIEQEITPPAAQASQAAKEKPAESQDEVAITNKDAKTVRPSSPNSEIGYSFARNNNKRQSKRFSVISFARNFINVSVYRDDDSERSDPLLEMNKKYIDARKNATGIALHEISGDQTDNELSATTTNISANNEGNIPNEVIRLQTPGLDPEPEPKPKPESEPKSKPTQQQNGSNETFNEQEPKATKKISQDSGVKRSRSLSKQLFNNAVKARSKSLLRKKQHQNTPSNDSSTLISLNEQASKDKTERKHKKSHSASIEYTNSKLPANFSVFVSKFILPNCEILDSFKVLEDEKLPRSTSRLTSANNPASPTDENNHDSQSLSDAGIYIVGQNDSTDQLITNGVHKELSKNNSSSSLKRSTFFIKRNSLKLLNGNSKKAKGFSTVLSKQESQPLSVPSSSDDSQGIDVNDKKYIKDIYKLETEDFVKILKYWNYDYKLPSSDELFPYLHNLELNSNQFNFLKHGMTKSYKAFSNHNSIDVAADGSFSQLYSSKIPEPEFILSPGLTTNNLSKLIPLPNTDKYFLLINTNNFYEYDDSKDLQNPDFSVDNSEADNLINYIRKKYYLKGSINPWEILDYENLDEEVDDEAAPIINADENGISLSKTSSNKKKDLKVRFSFGDNQTDSDSVNQSNGSPQLKNNNSVGSDSISLGDTEDDNSSKLRSSQYDDFDESFKGHRYIELKEKDLTINGKKFTGYCKPLNSLKKMNRIKNSGEGKSVLAHSVYNKKVNLRSYDSQHLLLFKISHVVIYNNDNNHAESLKFAKIFGLLQKKIFLQEEIKLRNLNLDQKNNFNEAQCFILNYDCQKISEFDVNHYNEDEDIILGLDQPKLNKTELDKNGKFATKFESVDTSVGKAKAKYNFNNRSDVARFLKTNPFLVPYSSSILKDNLTNWNKNYLLHEKIENWLTTSGTEIYTNIYIGNVIDYNNVRANQKLKVRKQSLISQLMQTQELKDAESEYKLRGKLLSLENKIMANNHQDYRILINCVEGAEFPNIDLIDSIFKKADRLLAEDTDLIYLRFPSSGSIVLSSMTTNDILSVVNLLKLLHYLSEEKGYKVLLYSYDGFSLLSLLSLFMEIYNNFLSLKNSIMKYYSVYERYMYWFEIDYEVLDFMEKFLLFFSPNNPDKRSRLNLHFKSNETIRELDFVKVKQWYEDVYCGLYNFNCYEFLKVYEQNPGFKEEKNKSVVQEIYKLDNSIALTLKSKKDDWFELKKDNNLPSKILDYLYLGSIDHLNSKTVLELLKLNYVITIGEKPKWLNLASFENEFDYDSLDPSVQGKILKDDIIEISNPLPFVKKLIYLPNVQDNGVDPFYPYFMYLLKLIKKIREENTPKDASQKSESELSFRGHERASPAPTGPLVIKNRIIVNCKAGVSRSASLCIAEVMNFLKISLPRAYLYARVRRLNLIIQPNLKIFYNLMKLEENLTIKENRKIKMVNQRIESYNRANKHKKRPEHEQNRKKELSLRKLRPLREVDWHILCKEIDLLNSHYIKG